MPDLKNAVVTLSHASILEIGHAIRSLFTNEQERPHDDTCSDEGPATQAFPPPPMSAGVVSDAIGMALAVAGHGDLVSIAPTPDGRAFHSLPPTLLIPAIRELWVRGWPVLHVDENGISKSGAPVFCRPPIEALEDAALAALRAAGRTHHADGSLGHTAAMKLESLGYGPFDPSA